MGLNVTESARAHRHFRGPQAGHGSSGTELKIIIFCIRLTSVFTSPPYYQRKPTVYSSQCSQPSVLSTNCPVPTPQTTWPWLEIQHSYFLKKRYKAMNSQKLCAVINTWNIPYPGGWHLKYVICGGSSCFGRTHVTGHVISLWIVVQWDTFSGWNESKLWPEICCVWTFMCDLFAHTSSRAALRIERGLL